MNKNQRQALLLTGFMALLSFVFVFLFVHGPGADERDLRPELNVTEDINVSESQNNEPEEQEQESLYIPIVTDAIKGWKDLLNSISSL